ncbi:MAG: ribonuclease III [Eubacteriales bacterium]|nr:ribonuclease III [Eubacteriales bacterium]
MDKLQKSIGYKFRNVGLLEQALTHKSYANVNDAASYERLEFLGDSVLSIIISQYLYDKFDFAEGDLTKIRACIVCEQSLAKCSRNLDIGEYMRLDKGEELSGGRDRESILADMFEAVLAAIYLDGGREQAKAFVMDNLKEIISLSAQGKINTDYKSHLQEIIQANGQKIEYALYHTEGPEHMRTFFSKVIVDGEEMGEGQGKTKKESEQQAAKEALETLQK